MSQDEPSYDGHSFSRTSRSETFFFDATYGPRIQYGYVSPNANQDLFVYDVLDSYFELGAATKKIKSWRTNYKRSSYLWPNTNW